MAEVKLNFTDINESITGLVLETVEQVAEVIRENERERIISLLETKSSEFAESHDWADVELLTYVISLIKGDVAERRQTQMSEYGDKGENK